MKLNDIFSGNYNAAEWEAKGYQLPKFDIKAVREKTAKEPTWVHFGEVAVREDVARTQVNEVCARSKLLGQLNHIIICTS